MTDTEKIDDEANDVEYQKYLKDRGDFDVDAITEMLYPTPCEVSDDQLFQTMQACGDTPDTLSNPIRQAAYAAYLEKHKG